jgi:small subunit ribosomal protein S4e
VVEIIKFEVGNTIMVTKGRNTGRVGVVTSLDKYPGSFDIATVKDASGSVFATRLTNLFTLGKQDSAVTLPKGKGIKLSIFEQRDRGASKQQQ